MSLETEQLPDDGLREIEFTEKKFETFKKVFAEAEKAGAEQFEFEGISLLTTYARYLIEYLSTHYE